MSKLNKFINALKGLPGSNGIKRDETKFIDKSIHAVVETNANKKESVWKIPFVLLT